MRAVYLAILCLLFSACSAKVPQNGTFQAAGLKIGKVEAGIDDSRVEAYPLEVFNKLGGREDLVNSAVTVLTQRGAYDPQSKIVLKIQVVDFRLRHGATRYFTGFFSGSDRIGTDVAVVEGGKTLLTKKIEGAGGNGNPFNVSRESRGNALFHYVAEQSANMLAREPLVR